MTTQSKDFKVKNGLVVAQGGIFGGTVQASDPVSSQDLTTKSYVDSVGISALSDVSTSSVTNRDILIYDGNNWVNQEIKKANDPLPDLFMMMGGQSVATEYKILGQASPSDTSNADLYTVPAETSAVISTLMISNTTTVEATCRIFARQAGAAPATTNAIIYDGAIAGNDFKAITVGITLAASDVITVQSGTADALTFQAFGSEVS